MSPCIELEEFLSPKREDREKKVKIVDSVARDLVVDFIIISIINQVSIIVVVYVKEQEKEGIEYCKDKNRVIYNDSCSPGVGCARLPAGLRTR